MSRFKAWGAPASGRADAESPPVAPEQAFPGGAMYSPPFVTVWPPSVPDFDAQRRCPKCGGEANVRWRHASEYLFHMRTYRDWVERRCERCDHTWDEKPLDAAAASAAKPLPVPEGGPDE